MIEPAIRVEPQPLARDDLVRNLTEPEASLIKRYKALLAELAKNADLSKSIL